MTERRAPGDHFSTVSAGYAAFRPRYPRHLFEFVASVAQRRRRAWDCGAGSGQATVDLAEWFDETVGSDVSAEQIARAPAHPRVRWLVARAEAAPLAPASIDVIVVAQALHWFDHARFYDEVRRVAAPGTTIGPMARADIREGIHRQVERTVGEGAVLVVGGQPIDAAGYFYEPTVLDRVTPAMRIYGGASHERGLAPLQTEQAV